MTENQSVSEKEKMDYQPDPDLLSDLPLSIIHIILALVPIREAVRTSILSRKWSVLSPSEIESLLERLELADARETELRISSPNLKYLHLDGCYTEICLNTPLLEQLLVLFLYDYDYQDVSTEKSSVCNYTNFFGGITNLKKLIGVYFTKFLSVGIEYCHRSVVLHHLKAIELNSVNSEDIKEILVVAYLIIGAPNLHKLKIELIGGGYGASEAEDLCFKGFGCAPNFTLEKLRIVEVSGVRGLFAEKELIKFLLESSVVLDMMRVYHIFTPFCTGEIQDLRDELLGCSRASPRPKISISFGLV